MAPKTDHRSTTCIANSNASGSRAGGSSQNNAGPSFTSYAASRGPSADTRAAVSAQRTDCPECSASGYVTDDGVRYCDDCGAVLSDERLERSEPGWKPASERRLGPQQSKQWVDTGTCITRSAENADRLIRYNERLTSSERSLVDGLREVRNLSASIELPESMRERAAYWYREATSEGLLKGRKIEGIAAACVYLAAREQHHPITVERLAAHSPIETSQVRHHVQVVRMKLSVTVPPAHPRDFLPLVVSRLTLDPGVERRAARYLERVTAAEFHVGKHPAAIAATVVYAAANDSGVDLTQQDVADAADVSAVTISRHNQRVQELAADGE